jgi:hypothetical protein
MRPVGSIAIALLGGALLVGGCGDDEKKRSSSSTAPSTAATTQAAPKSIDEAKQRLQAAGYKVTVDQSPEPLVRRPDGGIVTPKQKIEVTGGDLPSGSDVSVYGVSTPEDVAALQKLAGGGGLARQGHALLPGG